MLCTSLRTIINNFIKQRGVTGGGWGVLCSRTLQLLYVHITVYYHQSARRSRRGRELCYAHHRVLLIIINIISEAQTAQ
jgi:hypothetical protein